MKSIEIKFDEGIRYSLVEREEGGKAIFEIVGKDLANNQEKVLKAFSTKEDAYQFANTLANE